MFRDWPECQYFFKVTLKGKLVTMIVLVGCIGRKVIITGKKPHDVSGEKVRVIEIFILQVSPYRQ